MNLDGIQVAALSGPGDDSLYQVVMASDLSGSASELEAIYQHLIATREAIRQNPAVVGRQEDPSALLKMLDYAIDYFHTDQRDQALAVLAQNEDRMNALMGVSAMDGDELGAIQPKKFFSSIKTAVSNAGKAVAKVATTATKAVVKYNPVSIVARNGYLLALKLNVSGMAAKLKNISRITLHYPYKTIERSIRSITRIIIKGVVYSFKIKICCVFGKINRWWSPTATKYFNQTKIKN